MQWPNSFNKPKRWPNDSMSLFVESPADIPPRHVPQPGYTDNFMLVHDFRVNTLEQLGWNIVQQDETVGIEYDHMPTPNPETVEDYRHFGLKVTIDGEGDFIADFPIHRFVQDTFIATLTAGFGYFDLDKEEDGTPILPGNGSFFRVGFYRQSNQSDFLMNGAQWYDAGDGLKLWGDGGTYVNSWYWNWNNGRTSNYAIVDTISVPIMHGIDHWDAPYVRPMKHGLLYRHTGANGSAIWGANNNDAYVGMAGGIGAGMDFDIRNSQANIRVHVHNAGGGGRVMFALPVVRFAAGAAIVMHMYPESMYSIRRDTWNW